MSSPPEAVANPIGGYVPSSSLSYVGIACFGIVAVAFWFSIIKWWKKYMLVLTIGTTCMAVGFGVRIACHSSPTALGPYIGMTLFILLSPCAFLASNYMLLPRLAQHLGQEDKLRFGAKLMAPKDSQRMVIRKPRLSKYFVWSDVVTFWLQAGGGGLQASQSENLANIGHWIALVGLGLQLLSFAFFIFILLEFGMKVTREGANSSRSPWMSGVNDVSGTSSPVPLKTFLSSGKEELEYGRQENTHGQPGSKNMKVFFWVMLLSSAGLMIRSIFRVAEYATGRDGYLATTESLFYALDSLPILLAIAVYIPFWPPRWMPDSQRALSYFQRTSNYNNYA